MSKYKKRLNTLGITENQAARIFDVNPRTSRRWAEGSLPVPRAVMLSLYLLSTISKITGRPIRPEFIPDDP